MDRALSKEMLDSLKQKCKRQGLILYANTEDNACHFPANRYGFITDGERVISWNAGQWFGITFQSCCHASKDFGTGYAFYDNKDAITDLNKVNLKELLTCAQRHGVSASDYKPHTLKSLIEDYKTFHMDFYKHFYRINLNEGE